MRLVNGSRLLVLGLTLAVPLLTGANGNGCGPGQVIIGNDTGGGSTTSTGSGSTSCTPSECGPAPAIAEQCPDGSAVVPVCEEQTNGTCGWAIPPCGTPVVCNCPALPAIVEQCPDGSTVSPECVVMGNLCEVVFPTCPPGSCTPADCGPQPPTPLCPNGATVSPVCGGSPTGHCGWTVPPCPPTTCTPSECGPEPAIEVDCNGTPEGPVCEPDSSGKCGWVIPTCAPGGAIDGGAGCCPANWKIYSCTWPDGSAGQACHNPAEGCASSTTCGEGCDTVVSGVCGK